MGESSELGSPFHSSQPRVQAPFFASLVFPSISYRIPGPRGKIHAPILNTIFHWTLIYCSVNETWCEYDWSWDFFPSLSQTNQWLCEPAFTCRQCTYKAPHFEKQWMLQQVWVNKDLAAASGLEVGHSQMLSLTHVLPTSAKGKPRSLSVHRVLLSIDLAIILLGNRQNVI